MELIKLPHNNVHVRYSPRNLNFRQIRYKDKRDNDKTRVTMTLWFFNHGDYVALDTEKFIEKMATHGLGAEKYISVKYFSKKKGEGFFASKRNIEEISIDDCVWQFKIGSNTTIHQEVDGLDRAIQIAQGHTSTKGEDNLFTNPDLVELSDENHVGTTLYKIRDMDYSGTQSTDNSVDKDYLHRKQQDDAAKVETETTADIQSTDDSVDEEYQRRKQQEDAAEVEIETASDISDTEKEQITLARHGQGRFRNAVLKLYGFRCVLTGIETNSTLIASHIKPWADCKTAEQRLSPHNGLLLAATYDKLFDQGLITFDENGVLKISPQLSTTDRKKLFPDENIQRDLSPETQEYLQHHRDKIFKANKKP